MPLSSPRTDEQKSCWKRWNIFRRLLRVKCHEKSTDTIELQDAVQSPNDSANQSDLNEEGVNVNSVTVDKEACNESTAEAMTTCCDRQIEQIFGAGESGTGHGNDCVHVQQLAESQMEVKRLTKIIHDMIAHINRIVTDSREQYAKTCCIPIDVIGDTENGPRRDKILVTPKKPKARQSRLDAWQAELQSRSKRSK